MRLQSVWGRQQIIVVYNSDYPSHPNVELNKFYDTHFVFFLGSLVLVIHNGCCKLTNMRKVMRLHSYVTRTRKKITRTQIYILYNYELYKLTINIYALKYVSVFVEEEICFFYDWFKKIFLIFIIIIKIYTINLSF